MDDVDAVDDVGSVDDVYDVDDVDSVLCVSNKPGAAVSTIFVFPTKTCFFEDNSVFYAFVCRFLSMFVKICVFHQNKKGADRKYEQNRGSNTSRSIF